MCHKPHPAAAQKEGAFAIRKQAEDERGQDRLSRHEIYPHPPFNDMATRRL